MATLTHNKERKSDGKPMKAAGQRASLIASLDQLSKGLGEKVVRPVNHNRQGSWFSFFAGAVCFASITRIGADRYSVSWIRPAGRKNTYSDAMGKAEIVRSVTVNTATDLIGYFADIENQPTAIEIEVI
jgi:hypothetical protein